ncbi:MAG: cytochrome C [Saprospiraceae bacterium]|nr:cytochrome C [Saprospiraceae bacterium]
MKLLIKILKWLVFLIIAIIAIIFIYVQLSWNKKFEAPYPELKASTDSAVIARGKHLAYGPAHCGTCHVPMNKIEDVENGEMIPLSGGWQLTIPPGTFRAPNISPDKETGIGNFSDEEIARVMRHMVGKDGNCIFPFMPFAELSDEDLIAILSYLRSQEPVNHAVPATSLSFLGKALMAFGVIKPEGTKGNPPKSVKIDTTIDYGKYLANSVANCNGCHTERDLKTGAFVGKPFAGGTVFPPDVFTEGKTYVSPNITPDLETSIMSQWTEEAFIARFKKGRVHKGSPMPWGAFTRMDTLELKAIYRYLQSLEPVKKKINQVVYEPGEKVM